MAKIEVKEVKLPSFIKKKHELAKLEKILSRETEAAVKLLADTMHDETIDGKTRRDCAKTLIELKLEVSDTINKDEMQRLIAEIRINPTAGSKNLETDNSRPVLDFNTIQEVD